MTYDSAIPPSDDASTPQSDDAFESSEQGLASRQDAESFEFTETDGGSARRTRYPRKRPARRRDVLQDQAENTEAIIADSHTEDTSLDELEALFGGDDEQNVDADEGSNDLSDPSDSVSVVEATDVRAELSDDTVIMQAVRVEESVETPHESAAPAAPQDQADVAHSLPSIDLPVYDRTAEHQPIPEDEAVAPRAEVPYFDAPARTVVPDEDVAAAVRAAAADNEPERIDDEEAFDNYVDSLFPSNQSSPEANDAYGAVHDATGQQPEYHSPFIEPVEQSVPVVFAEPAVIDDVVAEDIAVEQPVAAASPRGRLDVEREDPNTSVQRARDRIPVIQTNPVVLSTQGLSKRFGATIAVNDINLQVRAGSFYGFVGPNGAGKTTTLSMVTGLLKPTAGSVVIQGADMWSSSADAKRLVGALPDRLRLFDRLTGAQLLFYSGVLHGLDEATVNQRATELSAALGLENALGRLVSDYSAGMQKKIALATAMIHSPRILVLDEPFESIDPVSAATVTDILEKFVAGGGSVLISSHSIDLIQRVCDHVAVIVQGNVVAAGTVDEVRDGITLEERFTELTGATDTTEGLEWLHGFSG
ncbi:ABC transporter ATP-binding protein [Lysinibacter cavernae]|uniref:ABC-type multidrug transport system ATPase subunit n=1 Tax=Lysinibacter cavernae TaxID=1640652 RepID=A0A7X5TSG9_9MICO|nr:ABC-type multidrug transport system ATPase subunit [Lysinibacter cavernae]